MFDPTAFDNMKVVIEGAFYDADLSGEILISGREDLMNLARLSREFIISFKMIEIPGVEAHFHLKAGVANLASELLAPAEGHGQAGCDISIRFTVQHHDKITLYKQIKSTVQSIWGADRKVTQLAIIDPSSSEGTGLDEITVDFNRLVTEEQLEDLSSLPSFMIETVQRISDVLSAEN